MPAHFLTVSAAGFSSHPANSPNTRIHPADFFIPASPQNFPPRSRGFFSVYPGASKSAIVFSFSPLPCGGFCLNLKGFPAGIPRSRAPPPQAAGPSLPVHAARDAGARFTSSRRGYGMEEKKHAAAPDKAKKRCCRGWAPFVVGLAVALILGWWA
jgi:hypothetical protein